MAHKPSDKKSADKNEPPRAKSPVDRASDLARQIWLAGVGAYGQAVDETQEKVNRRVAQVSEETTKFFEELVTRGSDLEQKLGALGKLSADVRAEGIKRSAEVSLSMEDRLSRMRDMLGLNQPGNGLEEKVDRLAAEVVVLSAKLDRLVEALAADTADTKPKKTKPPKAPVKKPVPKKAARPSRPAKPSQA